jgi:hypothetical protein
MSPNVVDDLLNLNVDGDEPMDARRAGLRTEERADSESDMDVDDDIRASRQSHRRSSGRYKR